MAVLAEEQGAAPALPFALLGVGQGGYLSWPSVHGAHDVSACCGRAPALVVQQPGAVGGADRRCHGFVSRTDPGLIAKAPHQNTRVVPVARHHPQPTLQEGGFPRSNVAGVGEVVLEVRVEAVSFDVGLVYHHETVQVAELVPPRVVGVVRAPHSVEVVALHLLDIPYHVLLPQSFPAARVVLDAVHAAQRQGLVVEKQNVAVGADSPEPYEAGLAVDPPPLGPQTDLEEVQRRVLSAPELGQAPGAEVEGEVCHATSPPRHPGVRIPPVCRGHELVRLPNLAQLGPAAAAARTTQGSPQDVGPSRGVEPRRGALSGRALELHTDIKPGGSKLPTEPAGRARELQPGFGSKVPDVHRRFGQQPNVTEDA